MITPEQFAKSFPENKTPAMWADACGLILPKYGIISPLRLAMFLCQTGHESNSFTAVRENLNYSADALARTWPNRYARNQKAEVKVPNDLAIRLQRNPEAIANNVYANRMGNGPEESGDGWKHRGRGLIQLTGKDRYLDFAKSAGKSYDDIFAYLETREGAVESACWYWQAYNLNALADTGDVVGCTRRINGGTNGLADRNARYTKILALLQT